MCRLNQKTCSKSSKGARLRLSRSEADMFNDIGLQREFFAALA